MDDTQKKAKAAQEIVKNNQATTYQINSDDMVGAIEEYKASESEDEVRKMRQAVTLEDESL